MQNFVHYSPTKVIFGKGVIPQLMPELQRAGVSRVLLMAGGKSVFESGLHGMLDGMLRRSGFTVRTVGGVQPNPRVAKVREGVAEARDMQAQAVIPIGGGSVFDSAKAVAAGAASEQDIWEMIRNRIPVRAALPIYGIVTLSGTSSELNPNSVITNEDTNEKLPFASELVIPRVAVVDPELQYSVPLKQLRFTGLDALSHILESYFQGLDTSEAIIEHCEAYARNIIRCLRALPEAECDYRVRAEFAFCCTYAFDGWAFVGRAVKGDYSSHRIGHALGGMFDIPHGVTLGIIMPNWMRYIYGQGLNHDVFARFASRIMGVKEAPGGDFALAGVEAFTAFVRSLDMPVSMRDVGIGEKDIPALAENAAVSLPYGCIIPMTKETISAVLRQAL